MLHSNLIKSKNTIFSQFYSFNCGGKLIAPELPLVMGILNITPDSFYDGGKYQNEKSILKRVEQMLSEGAGIIDIGAVSTRPGSQSVDKKEEHNRLIPALKAVVKEFPDAIISIDTYRSAVAAAAVSEGAHIINDISAGGFDAKMFDTIAKLNVPYIMMHMQGTPQNMQLNPQYDDVVNDIILFFAKKITQLTRAGAKDIIVDPGFGFGKTVEQNYELLNGLDYFKTIEAPLMVGISRKSMIYKLLETTSEEALNGTSVAHSIALMKGADMLRVHDVKEAVQAIKIIKALTN